MGTGGDFSWDSAFISELLPGCWGGPVLLGVPRAPVPCPPPVTHSRQRWIGAAVSRRAEPCRAVLPSSPL